MTYTGHVVPGGPTDVRELGRATIRKMAVSEMHNNVYLLDLPRHRRAAHGRRRRRRAPLPRAGARGHRPAGPPRHHAPALGPRPGPGGRGRRARRRAPTPAPTTPATCPSCPTCGCTRVTRSAVGELELDVIHLRGHTPGSVALAWHDPDGVHPPLHRRLALPRRGRQHEEPGTELRVAVRRRQRAGLRRLRRRHLVLPRPRRRLDARRRASAPRGVARPRVVSPGSSPTPPVLRSPARRGCSPPTGTLQGRGRATPSSR